MHFSHHRYSTTSFPTRLLNPSVKDLWKRRLNFTPTQLFDFALAGTLLVFAGVVVILIAFLLSSARGKESRPEVRGGGVIMIGPVPIVFGSDAKWASFAIVLAIVLMVVALLLYNVV
jgi:uncharacterized protein (TIGR00304 family)